MALLDCGYVMCNEIVLD